MDFYMIIGLIVGALITGHEVCRIKRQYRKAERWHWILSGSTIWTRGHKPAYLEMGGRAHMKCNLEVYGPDKNGAMESAIECLAISDEMIAMIKDATGIDVTDWSGKTAKEFLDALILGIRDHGIDYAGCRDAIDEIIVTGVVHPGYKIGFYNFRADESEPATKSTKG